MRLYIKNIQEDLENKLAEIQKTNSITISDQSIDSELFTTLFQHCPQIKILEICNEQLTVLPNLQALQHLESLELRCPNLSTIPENHFPKIVSTFRSFNSKLSSFPDFIWQSKNSVSLENKEIEILTIPENTQVKSISLNLPKLEQLNFGNNQTKIVYLEICANSLKYINNSFSHLKTLDYLKINAPINQVDCDFSELIKLRRCQFEKWDLEKYHFLKNIKQIHFLEIKNPLKKWHGLPDISKWEYLSTLRISDCLDPHLTHSILEGKHLRELYIHTSNINFQPAFFANCSKLISIELNQLPAINFADCVQAFPHKIRFLLRRITLTNFDKISKNLEVDWTNLTIVDCTVTIKNYNFLDHFPQLTYLILHPSHITSPNVFLRKKAVPIAYKPKMMKAFKFKNFKQYLSLCSAIERSNLPQADKEFFVDYFRGRTKIEVGKTWNWTKILKATNIPFLSLKKKLMALIDEKVEAAKSEHPISDKTVLYITGTPKMKITAFRKLVKELGIQLVKSYSEEVTHVVIGTKSPDYDLLDGKQFAPITDVDLQKLLTNKQPQFLKEQLDTKEQHSTEMTANMEQLLLSSDVMNVKIGLEMIKNGGLPASLFPTLLVVQKTTADAKIRNAIKPILEVQADAEWKPLVRDRLSFKMVYNAEKSGVAIRRQVKALAKKLTPTLAAKFSFILFKKTGKGLRYALTARLKEALKKEAYQLILSDNHFDFSKGMAFSKRPENPKEYYDYSLPESSVVLPVLATKLGTIHSLNLTNCRYNILSEKITQFKDLKHLNLATNELTNLPSYLAALENLETINLSENYLREFPEVLSKLPNLKQVNLADNKNVISVPASFLASHPACIVQC